MLTQESKELEEGLLIVKLGFLEEVKEFVFE